MTVSRLLLASTLGGALAYRASRATKGRLVVAALRGHPIAYKLHIKDGTLVVTRDHTQVVDCHFSSSPVAVSL